MKRIAIVFMMLFAVIAVNAQTKGFVCTGDNVNVRKGPGKNYPVDNWGIVGYKRQLMKGDVVENLGKSKNGFCLICGPLKYNGEASEGWVSAQYLRPVTLCPECIGTGVVNISEQEIDLENCKKCKGKGYVK